MIEFSKLNLLLEILIEHASFMGITSLEPINEDYYWSIGDERYDVDTEPSLAVGSIFDDNVELLKLLENPQRATANDFDRLANILHLISKKITS